VQWRQNSCAKHVVSQARLSLPPRECLAHETTERGEDGKWALCMHTTCVDIPHTHISVSGVDRRNLWGTYPGVLSDTPTECATVPSLKQNTRHYAKHALSRTCACNQTWYRLHLRVTLFHNYTIEQCRVCLHWRLLVCTWNAVTTCTPVTIFFPLGLQLCS